MKVWAFLTAIGMCLIALLVAGHTGLLEKQEFASDLKMLIVGMMMWFVPSPLTGRLVSTPGAPPSGMTPNIPQTRAKGSPPSVPPAPGQSGHALVEVGWS